jgi:hypothetical protein
LTCPGPGAGVTSLTLRMFCLSSVPPASLRLTTSLWSNVPGSTGPANVTVSAPTGAPGVLGTSETTRGPLAEYG